MIFVFDPAGAVQQLEREATGLTRSQLAASLRECARLEAWVAARKMRLVAEFDRQKAYRSAGAVSSAAWMNAQVGMTEAAAASTVRVASGLSGLEQTSAALGRGEISADHAARLARAKTGDHGDRLDVDAEAQLLAGAVDKTPEQFSRQVSRWERAQSADDGSAADDRKRQKRSAKKFKTADGLSGLRALFDPVSGAMFFGALDTFVSRRWQGLNPDGGLVPPASLKTDQLMLDSLIDMAKAALANLTSPGVTPRPLVGVQIDIDTLLGRLTANSLSQLDDGTPIAAETARRLACEGGVIPYVFKGAAQLLDMGRRARIATQNQVNALFARDGGTCCVKGCNVPADWCQAHHVDWWEHGGPTDLSNLVMLCSKHHHLVHEGGWRIERRKSDGRFRLIDPGGLVVSEFHSDNHELREQLHTDRQGDRSPPIAA